MAIWPRSRSSDYQSVSDQIRPKIMILARFEEESGRRGLALLASQGKPTVSLRYETGGLFEILIRNTFKTHDCFRGSPTLVQVTIP